MTTQANEQATEQVSKQSGVQTGEHSRHAPQSDATPIIDTTDLWRIYKLGSQEISALRGIDMTIGSGEFLALKGRSGSGKTTLLNCVGGLDSPSKGNVRIFGEEIGGWSERKLTKWRRQHVGFIFQSLGLMPTLSAYENVELIMRIRGAPRKERHDKVIEALDLVGLIPWMDHRPFELSGGQQQRVAIARALVTEPGLVLADEPTGELDSKTAQEILGLFQSIVRERNMTILMATHDSLVDEFVDEIMHLQDGQIVSEDELHHD
jgi:putative ABC transport system ATP-binding protein